MHEIHVELDFDDSIERVFDAISDHERLFQGAGIKSCRLTTVGRTDRNGVGAVREIEASGGRFVEEVVRFERPRRFDYIVRSVTLGPVKIPMQHELGWIELEARGGKTRVHWRTRFSFGLPIVGALLARAAGPRLGATFKALLERARRDLERTRAAA